jgi:hypothetical protein
MGLDIERRYIFLYYPGDLAGKHNPGSCIHDFRVAFVCAHYNLTGTKLDCT